VPPLVTTYLEMVAFRPQSRRHDIPNFETREQTQRDWRFNRKMYLGVGQKWNWIDKRPWTDAEWKNYANDPNLRTFASYRDEALIGYYELRRTAAEAEANHRKPQITSQRWHVTRRLRLKSLTLDCCRTL
jgi:hypothetical protein